MDKQRTKQVVVVSLLVVLVAAGCSAPPDIDVSIEDVSETSTDGSTTFRGTLTALDQYEGKFVIRDVRVEFEDENGNLIQSVSIGDVTETSFSHNISVELEQPPERIMIRTGEIETKATVDIHHLKRNESGGYEYFRTEE